MSTVDWRKYVNKSGDFELPAYLYKMITSLMKESLDLGTMLSNDPAKTRAFKERIKESFKEQWLATAEILEAFGIIVRCECFDTSEYCKICGGSRYQLNGSLSPSVMKEIAFFTAKEESGEVSQKLAEGLQKALVEVEQYDL
jgi:hypothetical protein